jgi:hypothetical protein
MGRSAFDAKLVIASLNEIKQDKNIFTEEECRMFLKECGIPSNILFFKEFKNSLLRKIGNKYTFQSIKPIHFNDLQVIYNRYYKIVNAEKKDPIQEAIELLKRNGYKIFKEI